MGKIIDTQGLFNTENIFKTYSSSISKICFDYIRKILPKGKTILELGSGWGTSELAKHYKMISIEHDDKYLEQYDSEYIYAPIKLYDSGWPAPDIIENDGWYDISALEFYLKDKKYDMILVDGPPGWEGSAGPGKTIGRGGFYKHLDLFNTKVPIIIDDINRKPEYILMKKLSKKLNKKYTILDDKATGVIL